MQVAQQSSLLLSTTWNDLAGTLPYNPTSGISYSEFNFVPDCVSPSCPSDYGSLAGRSLIPDGFNGSMSSSSVYMFDGNSQCAFQTDAQV
jgi:hypothetical protein